MSARYPTEQASKHPVSVSSVSSVVRQVHEYYAEFCAVNEDFFSANCPDTLQLALPRPPATAKTLLSRNRDAVLSVLLALKKKPSSIRYAVRFTQRDDRPAPIGDPMSYAAQKI